MRTADWLTRALSSHKRGDYADAVDACALAPGDRDSQKTARSLAAAALVKLGRAAEALQAIHAARQLGARSAELCRLAARICLDRGQHGHARDWIDHGLREDPGSRQLLQLREEAVLGMHLLSGLHEHMELAVRLHADDLEAREKLIRSFFTSRLFGLAGEQLDIAIRQHPQRVSLLIDKGIACIECGRRQDAVDALQRALACPAEIPERLRIADLLIKAGALELACRTAADTQAQAPDNPEARVQGGFFALWQGDPATARKRCERVSSATPGLLRLRAAIAFVVGNDEEALALATNAVAMQDGDAVAHSLRAAALLRLGRYAEASTAARDAGSRTAGWLPPTQLIALGAHVAASPEVERFEVAELFELFATLLPKTLPLADARDMVASIPILRAVEHALQRLSGNFSEATTFIPEGTSTWTAISLKPPARTACVRAANSIQVRPWAWAVEHIHALAEVYPGSPYVHTHAAELWLWYGDYAAAEAECRRAIALTRKEGSRWAWVGLGAALMCQERYAEALAVYEESDTIWAPGAPLLAYRGEILRRMGEHERARRDLLESLAKAPTRVSAWLNLGLIAAALGDYEEVYDIYQRLCEQLPQLMRDIANDMPEPPQPGAANTDSIVALFGHALRCMRGNRSTSRITYFLRDGEARVQTGQVLAASAQRTQTATAPSPAATRTRDARVLLVNLDFRDFIYSHLWGRAVVAQCIERGFTVDMVASHPFVGRDLAAELGLPATQLHQPTNGTLSYIDKPDEEKARSLIGQLLDRYRYHTLIINCEAPLFLHLMIERGSHLARTRWLVYDRHLHIDLRAEVDNTALRDRVLASDLHLFTIQEITTGAEVDSGLDLSSTTSLGSAATGTDYVRLFRALGLTPENVHFQRWPLDDDVFAPQPTTVPDPPFVAFSGGDSGRDYATLFAAIDGLPMQLRLCANSYPKPTPANVTILPRLLLHQFRDEMAGATATVVPLSGQPPVSGITVVAMAMMLAKPVIASDSPVVRMHIRAPGEDGYLVPIGDVAALRAKLVQLIESPAERQRVGEQGRAQAAVNLSLKAFVERMLNCGEAGSCG